MQPDYSIAPTYLYLRTLLLVIGLCVSGFVGLGILSDQFADTGCGGG